MLIDNQHLRHVTPGTYDYSYDITKLVVLRAGIQRVTNGTRIGGDVQHTHRAVGTATVAEAQEPALKINKGGHRRSYLLK
jgi:hypothetical protein